MSALRDAILLRSPVHYHPCDETSGTSLADLGSSPSAGSIGGSGVGYSIAGLPGDAGATGIRTNGTAYALLPPPPSTQNGAWSAIAFVRKHETLATEQAVQRWWYFLGDAGLGYYGDSTNLRWQSTGGGSLSQLYMGLNGRDWQMIGVTCTGNGTAKVNHYVDGWPVINLGALDNNTTSDAIHLSIGGALYAGTLSSPCDIDICHSAVFSSVLTDADMRAIWEAAVGFVLPAMSYEAMVLARSGVRALLPCNDPTGTTAADASGHGRTGTYTGTFTLSGPDGSGLAGQGPTSGHVSRTGAGADGITLPAFDAAATSGTLTFWAQNTPNTDNVLAKLDPLEIVGSVSDGNYYGIDHAHAAYLNFAPEYYIDYNFPIYTARALYQIGWDSAGVWFAVNGQVHETSRYLAIRDASTVDNAIFTYAGSFTGYGEATEIAIYDRSLTRLEIYEEYIRGITPFGGVPPDATADALAPLRIPLLATAIAGPVPAPSPPAALITLRVDMARPPVHVPVRFPTTATVRDPRQSTRLEIE